MLRVRYSRVTSMQLGPQCLVSTHQTPTIQPHLTWVMDELEHHDQTTRPHDPNNGLTLERGLRHIDRALFARVFLDPEL